MTTRKMLNGLLDESIIKSQTIKKIEKAISTGIHSKKAEELNISLNTFNSLLSATYRPIENNSDEKMNKLEEFYEALKIHCYASLFNAIHSKIKTINNLAFTFQTKNRLESLLNAQIESALLEIKWEKWEDTFISITLKTKGQFNIIKSIILSTYRKKLLTLLLNSNNVDELKKTLHEKALRIQYNIRLFKQKKMNKPNEEKQPLSAFLSEKDGGDFYSLIQKINDIDWRKKFVSELEKYWLSPRIKQVMEAVPTKKSIVSNPLGLQQLILSLHYFTCYTESQLYLKKYLLNYLKICLNQIHLRKLSYFSNELIEIKRLIEYLIGCLYFSRLQQFDEGILFNSFKQTSGLSLYGRLPGSNQIVYFSEEKTVGDGSCGFTALGTTRDEVADTLLTLVNNKEARESLQNEIHAAFEEDSAQNQFSNLPIEWHQLSQDHIDRQTEVDNILRTINDRISNLPTSGNASSVEDLQEQRKQWLEQAGNHLEAKKLKEAEQALLQAEETLMLYCKQPDVFSFYCERLKGNAWLGCHSALLYAKTRDITLYILKRSKHNHAELEVCDSYCSIRSSKQPIYMLYTNGYTHFNSLVRQEQPESIKANLLTVNSNSKNKNDELTGVHFVLDSIKEKREKIFHLLKQTLYRYLDKIKTGKILYLAQLVKYNDHLIPSSSSSLFPPPATSATIISTADELSKNLPKPSLEMHSDKGKDPAETLLSLLKQPKYLTSENDFQEGDILIKYSDESLANKLINTGNKIHNWLYGKNIQLNISHVALYIGKGHVVEAIRNGLQPSPQRDTTNQLHDWKEHSWDVFRLSNEEISNLARDIAVSLVIESKDDTFNGSKNPFGLYDLLGRRGAFQSVLRENKEITPETQNWIKELTENFNLASTVPCFYCSNFAVFVYALACTIHATTHEERTKFAIDIDPGTVLPAVLHQYLQNSSDWHHVGLFKGKSIGEATFPSLYQSKEMIFAPTTRVRPA